MGRARVSTGEVVSETCGASENRSRPVCRRSLAAIFAIVPLLLLTMATGCEHAGPTLIISGPVHVYKTEIPPATYPGTDFIAELHPGDHPKVLEVRSGNGYRAVKVRLADGREGWVFSGESIELR
jgi:hypothetical protein